MKRSLAWSWPTGAATVALFVLALCAASAAEPASLSSDELRKAISGKTVYLNISGFELPIRYSASGRMSGKMSTLAASLSRGDGSSDTGNWWVGKDSSASDGRAGWTARPIATSSRAAAQPCGGLGTTATPALRVSAADRACAHTRRRAREPFNVKQQYG